MHQARLEARRLFEMEMREDQELNERVRAELQALRREGVIDGKAANANSNSSKRYVTLTHLVVSIVGVVLTAGAAVFGVYKDAQLEHKEFDIRLTRVEERQKVVLETNKDQNERIDTLEKAVAQITVNESEMRGDLREHRAATERSVVSPALRDNRYNPPYDKR